MFAGFQAGAAVGVWSVSLQTVELAGPPKSPLASMWGGSLRRYAEGLSWLSLLMLTLLSVGQSFGCEPAKKEEPAPSSPSDAKNAEDLAVVEPAPTPVGDETTIGEGGGLRVTLKDYKALLRRVSAMGRTLTPEVLADGNFQREAIVRALRNEVVRAAAKERGIVATDEDRRARIEKDPALQGLKNLDAVGLEAMMASRGASTQDLWDEIDLGVFEEKLTGLLLSEIDETELWTRYQQERSRISLRVIRLLNVPSSQEISDTIAANPAAIQDYYRENRKRYELPSQAQVRRFVLRVPYGATARDIAELKQRIEGYRARARVEDFAALVAEASEDPLTDAQGGQVPPVSMQRLPAAFEVPIGELTEVLREPMGFAFYKVESRRDASVRELDPALEREIASALIQKSGAAPSIAKSARDYASLLDADQETFEGLTGRVGVDAFELEPFSAANASRLPQLGYLPKVFERAFALSLDVSTQAEPLLDGDYVYVFKLMSKEVPDRLRFAAELETYRASVLELERPRIARSYLSAREPANIKMGLRELQAVYGVLQEDGTIGVVGVQPPMAAPAK